MSFKLKDILKGETPTCFESCSFHWLERFKDKRPCGGCEKWGKGYFRRDHFKSKYRYEYICPSCCIECPDCEEDICPRKYRRCVNCNMNRRK